MRKSVFVVFSDLHFETKAWPPRRQNIPAIVTKCQGESNDYPCPV
jgi:hypothetical protein